MGSITFPLSSLWSQQFFNLQIFELPVISRVKGNDSITFSNELPQTTQGLYIFVRGFRRSYKQRGLYLLVSRIEKALQTNYSVVDQNMCYINW